MYLDYFSLERHPFRITPDPSLFFPGGAHGRGVVLDALVYGITSGEGILKVVGEVGSGKTMLCRMLEERLPKSIEIVYIANPSLGAREIVYAIAIELGLDVDANTDRLQVMHKLQEFLLRKHGEGGSVVVFIEEAQSMPLETLEEVRLLSNLETHRHKLMQIVLFGQPELDRKLEQKSIRQLRERITHSFQLDPLGPDETREYLHFRLQSAGCPWPQLFHPKAELMLARASGGLTRRINILADKSLLASYADPATRPEPRNGAGEIQPMVLPRHVKVAIADSAYKRMGSYAGSERRVPAWLGYTAAALIGALAVGAVLWWQELSDTRVQAVTGTAVTQPGAALDVSVPARLLEEPARQVEVPARLVEVPARQVEEPPATTAVLQAPDTTDTVPRNDRDLGTASITDAIPDAGREAASMAGAGTVADTGADSAADTDAGGVAVDARTATTPMRDSPSPESPATTTARPGAGETYQPASGPEPAREGLIPARQAASRAWLAALPGKSGYTVQLYSVAAENTAMLEEFLDFLSQSDLLEDSWLCRISANSRRTEQWLVLHGEFPGLSDSRRFIAGLPAFVRQHGPYVRNLDGVACANARS